MSGDSRICLIIPALNESEALAKLLPQVVGQVSEVIVVDNGSEDETAAVAWAYGAKVVREPRRGYGQACLSGIAMASQCDVLVFLDADLSDDPAMLPKIVRPVLSGEADFVLGSRMSSQSRKALSISQLRGNQLVCFLMRLLWGAPYTDLGPFRAISPAALNILKMQDLNFGWTVEMQIRAVRHKLRIKEIPLPYVKRLYGRSKVTGTVRGVFFAGTKILWVVAREFMT